MKTKKTNLRFFLASMLFVVGAVVGLMLFNTPTLVAVQKSCENNPKQCAVPQNLSIAHVFTQKW